MSVLLDTRLFVYMEDIFIFSKTAGEQRCHVMQVFEDCMRRIGISEVKNVHFLTWNWIYGSCGVWAGHQDCVDQGGCHSAVAWSSICVGWEGISWLGQPLSSFCQGVCWGWTTSYWSDTQRCVLCADFWLSICTWIVKNCFQNWTVLQVFDDTKPSEVWVDASQFAVGATLVQPGKFG